MKIFYQPVGEVDVGFSVAWSGVVFKEAGDADIEVWEGEDLLLPVLEGVHVGEYNDLSSFEGCESFSRESGFDSGCQPGVLGHEGRADDGCLFGFDEGDCGVWVLA